MKRGSGRAAGILGGVVAVVIAFAGCAPSAGVPSEPTGLASESPGTTPSQSPSQSPSPTSPGPESATWMVDLDGVGPIRVTESLAAAAEGLLAAGYSIEEPEGCDSTATVFTSEHSPAIMLYSDDGSDRISVIVVGGGAVTAQQQDGSPRTIDGIGIGSTLAQLQSAFPDGEVEVDFGDRFVAAGATASGDVHYLSFLLVDGKVERYTVQLRPTRYWDFC